MGHLCGQRCTVSGDPSQHCSAVGLSDNLLLKASGAALLSLPFLASPLPSCISCRPQVPKPVSYVPSHLCLKFILWGKQVLVKVTPLVSEGAGSLPPSAPVSSEALTETNKQTNKPFVKLRPRGHTFSSNSENSRAKSPKSSEHPDVHSKEKPGSGHEHESSNCYSF